MQTALFLLIFLPPPTPGTLRLADANRAGAGGAADRRKSAIVQDIVGNTVVSDVTRKVLPAPISERIDFDKPVLLVDFGERGAAPVLRLFGAKSGDPRVCTGERSA
jgi:hypothetical protein